MARYKYRGVHIERFDQVDYNGGVEDNNAEGMYESGNTIRIEIEGQG